MDRPVLQSLEARPTREGAGVRLRRAFGFHEAGLLDPFLLLDWFRSRRPEDYAAGFPWHPHRGIVTITLLLEGFLEHGDSLGHREVLGPGEVQWMTAGRGILHQEMPRGSEDGCLHGFQLWLNLPARRKLEPPAYRTLRRGDLPEAEAQGVRLLGIAGEAGGLRGPAGDPDTDPQLLLARLEPGAVLRLPLPPGHEVFAFIYEGEGAAGPEGAGHPAAEGRLLRFGPGEALRLHAGAAGLSALVAGGRPLREPIAWHGPIVMNTREEIAAALAELEAGTFGAS